MSCIGTLTEHLSGYIDSVLNPLLPTISSYVQDTTHFLRILEDIDNIPPGSLLVTMDVSALYTTIPHDEGVSACKSFLSTNGFSNSFIKEFLCLIDFILKHNNFEFNGSHYLQICGTAMGSKMAPSYAIIFMADLESKLLSNSQLKPLHYYRYIDDIFFIWPHGLDNLNAFFTSCNDFHPSIKFTHSYSDVEIPFLDVMVQVNHDSIATTLYCKPTDTHTYLNFNSSHHVSLKKSIVFSQCIRIKRICSSQFEYDRHVDSLVGYFLENDYPLKLIKDSVLRASRYSRSQLLLYKPKASSSRIHLGLGHSPKTENTI